MKPSLAFATATFIYLALQVNAFVAPSALSKFHLVLARSRLQTPVSNRQIRKLFGYSNWSFHLRDDTFMHFQIRRKGRRSELRQQWITGTAAAWQPSEPCRALNAEVSIPPQERGLVEVSFLQILCSQAPLLRVTWREYFGDDRDVIVAAVRKGLGDDNLQRFKLGYRSSDTTAYRVLVSKNKLTIWMSDKVVLSKKDVSFFEKDDCYFKAGVYVNYERNQSALARTKFKDLDWWC